VGSALDCLVRPLMTLEPSGSREGPKADYTSL
jgi:hypothetical protein